jgi:hypothetical protein
MAITKTVLQVKKQNDSSNDASARAGQQQMTMAARATHINKFITV